MRSWKKNLFWQLLYGVCYLLYVGWMVQLSVDNFGMVHRQYQRAGRRLQPARIEAVARNELMAQCREATTGGANVAEAEDPCRQRKWSGAVVQARQKEVHKRLLAEWGLSWRKLLLFYFSFGVFFLVLPPLLLYLLISFLLWLFKNLRIVK